MVKNSQGTATLSKHPAVTDLEEGPVGPAPPLPIWIKKKKITAGLEIKKIVRSTFAD